MIFLALYTMQKLVKILLANEQVFPQTVAEAVLVSKDQVTTLDKILDKKLENIITAQDSGLTSYKQGTSVILTHTNKITPNEEPKPLLVQHDNNGHILNTDPFKKWTIIINQQVYSQYDGSKDAVAQFSDDFKVDDSNNISLTWGRINN